MAKPNPSLPLSFSQPFPLLALALLAALLLVVPDPVESITAVSDIQVLHALRESIDPVTITTSSFLYSWDFNVDPCDSPGAFLGILCSFPLDNTSSRVIAIGLDDAGYDGFLSPAIGNLTELVTLDITGNKFRGPIPETIVNLRQLTKLLISENLFTGQIPEGITKLKLLQEIDVSRNHLSGQIPMRIAVLRSLTRLIMSDNAISGRLPDLAGMWQLSILDVSYNELYGNIPRMPRNVRTLLMTRNVLSGHISPLKHLRRLLVLDLSSNRLSGRILHEILTMSTLVRLNVSHNHFTAIDQIDFPSSESRLQVIDANDNQIHGHLPLTLAGLENLTSLDLSHNYLTGSISSEFGGKVGKPWTNLFLNDNFLQGNIPPKLVDDARQIRGNFANNCLKCPSTVQLCRGGQRPHAVCAAQR
ncbi:LRR receptor-like serine/threonine-protein kinase GSO1 [Linum grandiflorum]